VVVWCAFLGSGKVFSQLAFECSGFLARVLVGLISSQVKPQLRLVDRGFNSVQKGMLFEPQKSTRSRDSLSGARIGDRRPPAADVPGRLLVFPLCVPAAQKRAFLLCLTELVIPHPTMCLPGTNKKN